MAQFPLNWELDSLLPNPATDDFRKILEQFRNDLQKLAERSDGLPPVNDSASSVTTWREFLADFQAIEIRATDLNAHIGCHASADAGNKLFQQLDGALSALNPLRERVLTNLDFAMQEASDVDLKAFESSDEALSAVAFFLKERKAHATLRLPKEQELLAADLAVDGLHAWGRLYDRVSGDLRVTIMQKGELVQKSPGQVRFDMADRATRENNFCAANKAWGTISDTCADALNHISGTRLTLYRRLGLQDHLVMPLRYNRMKRETLDAMWGAISARKGMLQQYLQRKADQLSLKKLSWFDLTAPCPTSGSDSDFLSYDDAVNQVIRTFEGFSPEFGAFAQTAITEGWVEVEDRTGKRQGGFCTGFPGKQQSRIFMTYTNSPDSMSTLAHELGHAYHSHVLREQPFVLQDYPMNLAETASTFAEAVLGEERLKASQSDSEQLTILDGMLSDAVAFLMNIHCRFLFEDNFHVARAEGELTAAKFSELMVEAQREAYCDSLDNEGWNPLFWASKLHFYISGLPFYNFPYTFGYLLSLGVYALAAESGPDFPEKYRSLLLATGCMETEEAVQSTLGYDLTRPDFWNKSLDIVESRVARFLKLSDS